MQKESGVVWETPVPFDDISVPSFPVECLPTTLQDYAKAVSESTQTSVDMPSVAGLLCLSACLQGKYRIQGSKGYTEPLNLYGVIIAKPAERKSSIISAMTRYIYQYEQEKNIELQDQIEENSTIRNCLNSQIKELEKRGGAIKNYEEFRQQAVQKKKELDKIPEIKPIRLIADDVSPEALTSLLADNNGKMSVISAEGGLFDIIAGRYSNNGVNIDTFLKAHSGDNLRVDRKGRPSEYINNPCLSILLAIQPQVLDGIMDNEVFRGRGLIGRFLYSYPTSRIGTRNYKGQPIPLVYENDYKKLIYELMDIPCGETPYIIKLSDDAFTMIENEFNCIEQRLVTDLEPISEWAGKYIGAVLRIVGILHIAEYKDADTLVSGNTMHNAIEIGHYFIEHAKLSFSIMGANQEQANAKYVLKYISKDVHSEISKREIHRLCSGRFKKIEDLEPVLSLLCDYGYLFLSEFQDTNDIGRRKSPVYYINPVIYAK